MKNTQQLSGRLRFFESFADLRSFKVHRTFGILLRNSKFCANLAPLSATCKALAELEDSLAAVEFGNTLAKEFSGQAELLACSQLRIDTSRLSRNFPVRFWTLPSWPSRNIEEFPIPWFLITTQYAFNYDGAQVKLSLMKQHLWAWHV